MRGRAFGLLAAALSIAGTPASAQVRDAVYRGTMVCDKMPFTVGNGREAIEVTIAGSEAKYGGAFVRRHASLKGAQIWNDGGKPSPAPALALLSGP